MTRELIHAEEREGFRLATYRLDEDVSPRGQFDSGDPDLDQEIYDKIDNGDLDWFCVEVTATKLGIELASEYLGGCCYETPQAFVTAGDYYADMCASVITEARATVAKLCAEG